MAKFNPSEYSVLIQYRKIDGHFFYVGTVKELPDVEVYEESYVDAYSEALATITNLYEMAQELSRPFPLPASTSTEYSGRLTLRVPKLLHKKIAEEAQNDDISINQFLIYLISRNIEKQNMISPIKNRHMEVVFLTGEMRPPIEYHVSSAMNAPQFQFRSYDKQKLISH
ncbi:toxin-antitoxin system HicB family antitoxin [Undibacterium sp. Di24W]|uniref:toxin-antitoxin system HicB family antitoxin n=1 Tax=Undibacterium sp. Di24W TaxID=3413033 RepID=UPI003BF0991B